MLLPAGGSIVIEELERGGLPAELASLGSGSLTDRFSLLRRGQQLLDRRNGLAFVVEEIAVDAVLNNLGNAAGAGCHNRQARGHGLEITKPRVSVREVMTKTSLEAKAWASSSPRR